MTRRTLRLPWLVLGLLCVALGTIGIIVPGLPTTVFFIGAAACFGRSSPGLERWVLGLPGVGPAVADYRQGRGMPLRAKVIAISSIVIFCGFALAVGRSTIALRVVVGVAGLIGIAFIAWRVPTRRITRPEDAGSGS